jgi:hypothetical protein
MSIANTTEKWNSLYKGYVSRTPPRCSRSLARVLVIPTGSISEEFSDPATELCGILTLLA